MEHRGWVMEHRESEIIDIGNDVSIRFLYNDDYLWGIDYWHNCINGLRVPDYIPIKGQDRQCEDHWDLVSIDPFTIAPSLLCRRCGHHGFIENGRWRIC
jgi:hypothetical protein